VCRENVRCPTCRAYTLTPRAVAGGTTRALLSWSIVSQPSSPLALGQINIVIRDMRKSLAFYRLLGLSIEEIPRPEWAPHHASGVASNGVHVEFDSIAFAKQWNPGLDEAKLGSATIPFFHVAAREDVDRVHTRVTAAGYRSQKAPEDAFWGAR
jgi:predicted lactoylglutathione lyase